MLKIACLVLSAQESKKRNVKAVPAFLGAHQGGCLWVRTVQRGEDGPRSTETYLLGGLLLLLLLLLSISLIFLCRSSLLNWWWGWLLLHLLLDSHEESNDLLGLDHVVLIDLEFSEDVVNLSLGHLVSPGHQSVLEHLGVNLAVLVVGLESLDNEVIGVVSVSGHLLLEHLDHVVVGAGTSNLSQQGVELGLGHEDTDVVEGSTEIIFVQGTVLVDVHQLEAVLVHLELLLGEATFILSLAHLAGLCEL